jgi:ATP-binding cassette subfamily B multidrug efflux pump
MIADDDAQLSQRLTQGQALGYFTRVMRQAGGYYAVLSACLLASLANAAVEVRLPQLMAQGIDSFMLSQAPLGQRLPGLTQLGLQYIALIVLSAGLGFAVNVGFNQVGQRVVERLRNQLFAHLHRLPMSYFDGNPVGRLVTRVANDTANLSEFFTGILSNLLCDLLKLGVLCLALFWASPGLTVRLFLLCPFLFACAYAFQRANTAVNREIRRQLAQLNAFLQENLQGLSTIKSFTAESSMQQEFDRQNWDYYRTEMRLVYLYMLFRPLFSSVSMLALVIILWIGGGQVVSGEISLGTLVLFIFYLKMLFAPLDDLAERFNVLQSAAVAAERIFQILDTPLEPGLGGGLGGGLPPSENIGGGGLGGGLPPSEGLRAGKIEFRDVHFAYTPDKPVLRGVSFVLEPGQKLALVGHTGCGKTTITSLLQRLYDLDAGGTGQILVDDRDIRDWPVHELRRQYGVIQQDLFLFRASLRHNLTLFREVSLEALQEALQRSRAEQVVAAHSEGLERQLGERGQQLSQGERQLISFARALVGDPSILILDEATASIDSLTEEAIQQALVEVLEGRTAIVVAHRLSTISHCDQILLLDHGQVVERGTHSELLAAGGAYAQLVQNATLD